MEKEPSHADLILYPALRLNLGWGFEILGFGKGGAREGSEGAEWGEWTDEGEREDLNVVESKVVEIGSTGQTGCLSRSDRSGQTDKENAILWFDHLGLKLIMINFN